MSVDERARVRAGTAEDAPGIAQVYVETWRSAYPALLSADVLLGLSRDRQAAYWRQVAAQGTDALHVAEAEGKVVGFSAAGPARPRLPDHRGEIYTLYVLPDHQGRGLGRSLVRAAFAALDARGLFPAVVWVLALNPARFFYERLGGLRAGTRDAVLGGVPHREIAYAWLVPGPNDGL